MLNFLAGHRPATAALTQMRACDLNVGIDLRGSRQIPVPVAGQSCTPTSSTNAFNGVGCHHAPRLPRANPHSARGTTACHFPRFPSLEAFGRRPQPRCSRPRPSQAGIRNPSQNLPCEGLSGTAASPSIAEEMLRCSLRPGRAQEPTWHRKLSINGCLRDRRDRR
jgi:hypothetical protein